MKNKRVFLILMAIVVVLSAKAQDYKMGLGARFSSNPAIVNHSISFKYFFNEKIAGEALFSFGDPLALGVLVAVHKPFVSKDFKYFLGGGAYTNLGGMKAVGLQGVAGIDYKVPNIPFNLSIDWKPELNLSKEFSFEPAALGLTARFTLK